MKDGGKLEKYLKDLQDKKEKAFLAGNKLGTKGKMLAATGEAQGKDEKKARKWKAEKNNASV